MSFLRYKALCIVINFIVLKSICHNTSLVYFNNGPEYITRITAQVFIPLIRFLLLSLVSRSFRVCLRYAFLVFSFISTCLIVICFQYSQVLVIFFFSKCSDSFLVWRFYPFRYFSFSTFYYKHAIFFYA